MKWPKLAQFKRVADKRGNLVISLSCVILLALTISGLSIKSYIIYRLRLNTKTKQAYEIMSVMEQASKVAGSAYAKNLITGGGVNLPPPQASCSNACLQLSGTVPQMCFDNRDRPDKPYCFYGGNVIASNMKLELRGHFEESEPFSGLDKLFAYFDKTFLNKRDPSLFGIFESRAIAHGGENDLPETVTLIGGNNFQCIAGNVSQGCMTCGPGTGRTCLTIYACPGVFKNCSSYTGGTSGALFVQNFYLIPPGVNE